MSEQCDDNLLDEDLGDEEYELGNDEEEALLADDYEVETQSSYKGEEETDDVLDLGVTDALDDLEGEEENVNYSGVTDSRNHSEFYEERHDNNVIYYAHHDYEDNNGGEGDGMGNSSNKPDLREKLQKSAQKDFYVGNGQGMEDDDCDEAKERRNRFQNERTIISPKMNHEIPDSLENVVTLEQSRPPFRGRGRGRGIRGIRGGRFIIQNPPNFPPRFNGPRGPVPFENQRPQFRPPLLENRPPYPQGPPRLNMPNQQIPFGPNNPQMGPRYPQFPLNGPPQIRPQFMENRMPFNPNQFQGMVGPPGPRLMGPRPDFDPRGPLLGPAPPHPSQQNYQPNNQPPPQFIHNQQQQQQQQHFQNQGQQQMQGNQGPPPPSMQRNQVPIVQVNNQGPQMQRPPPMQGNIVVQVPQMQGNQRPLMQGGQGGPPPLLRNPGNMMQGHTLRPQIHSQIPVMQSHHQNPQNISNQIQFDNVQPQPPYQDAHFCQEARPVYDSRNVIYNEQSQSNQYNNGPPPPSSSSSSSHPSQTAINPQNTGNVPNPLPPGHKILINPHFRGAVQPTTDARLVWDSTIQQQAPPPPSQIVNDQFIQPPGQFQDQRPYSQPPAPAQPPQDYTQPNVQQNKSDDPYAYFSDVWQENKSQKTPTTVSSNNSFHNETNYTRDNYYNEFDSNYKSQSQWESRDSYQGQREQQSSYRERDPHSRTVVERPRESRISSTNTSYRNESYEQNRPQRTPASRPPQTPSRSVVNRSQQKRSPDGFLDRGQRDMSPKRLKLNSRNLHEVRTIDTLPNTASEKKAYENEDPEMREYRKKLEEQKRAREKFLREKENRRKIAALEKQYDKDRAEGNPAAEPDQETKPVSVVTGVTMDVKPRPAVGRGRSRPVGAQPTEGLERTPGLRIVRTIQTVQPNVLDNIEHKETPSSIPTIQANEAIHKRQIPSQQGIRRVVIHKPLPKTQKVATTIQKTVSNLQKGTVNNAQQKSMQKTVANVSGGVQKTLIQKTVAGNVQKNLNIGNQKIVVNTANNQRVVLQKSPQQMRKLPEIKTNTVKIENLAASTTENQIRRMCQGIGTLESIRMSEGSATIVFKTQSAALVFHKKYQRKMLDLSLITVHLVPQTGGNKTIIPTVVKKS